MRIRAVTPAKLIAFTFAWLSAQPVERAAAQSASDLQSVAVTILRSPDQSWAGFGIYLGDGLVLTAAHVAGRAILTRPNVVVEGKTLPTEIVKEGSYPDNDLAVLRVSPPFPPAWQGRHTPVCDNQPRPDEAVVVVTPDQTAFSVVVAPEVLPLNLRAKYASSIRDVYTTGNSGSGVFDAFDNCLLGIMSSKIEQQQQILVDGVPQTRTVGVAKHFVPPADISAFLAGVSAK